MAKYLPGSLHPYYKHGLSRTALYKMWCHMRHRCYDANDVGFKNYGARGITICPAWKTSFEAFHAWALATGWQPGLTIERKNNNKGYSPSNCTFIEGQVQARNRRTAKLTTGAVKGIRSKLQSGSRQIDLASEYNVTRQTIWKIAHATIWKNV